MISPAKTKKGMARSEKTETPAVARWNVISVGKPSYQKAAAAAMPMAKATGAPMITPAPKTPSRMASPTFRDP